MARPVSINWVVEKIQFPLYLGDSLKIIGVAGMSLYYSRYANKCNAGKDNSRLHSSYIWDDNRALDPKNWQGSPIKEDFFLGT